MNVAYRYEQKQMSLEEVNKREKRRYQYEQALLAALKVGTIMSVAILMPNALQCLKLIGWVPNKRDPKYSFENAVDRLVHKKLIQRATSNDFYKITQKGKLFLWKYESKYISIPIPKKWDKKWRIIIFDIKESDRYQRDAIRIMLQNIGCIMLQNSVWVYPYECEEVVALLKANYEMENEVLYIISEKIESDAWLRKHFKLK
jgi:CRISPR-associated endonuclease Cas2